MRLVHRGGGQVVAVDERAFIDTTVHVPRVRQRLVGAHVLNREPSLRPVSTIAAQYRSGPFLKIAADGCRFFIAEGIMCGSKAEPRSSWCKCHRQRVYEKRATQ